MTIETLIHGAKKTVIHDPMLNGLDMKWFPVMQDIDWEVADTLRHKGLLPREELAFALVDNVPHSVIKDTRNQLFTIARGIYEEVRPADKDAPSLQAKQRRGATATQAYARDLVDLFRYISGLREGFPADVLSSNWCQVIKSSFYCMATNNMP